jgi:hypothetical protein
MENIEKLKAEFGKLTVWFFDTIFPVAGWGRFGHSV